MRIDYLCDHPEYIEQVSNWIYKEFVITSKSTYTLEKVIEYFGNTKKEAFPITLVAVNDDNECTGTISLFENDLKSQNDLKPWLASLYVEPLHRKEGIAQKLIEELLKITGELGYEKLYLRTEHAADYYRMRNWDYMYKTYDEHKQETEVFSKKTK